MATSKDKIVWEFTLEEFSYIVNEWEGYRIA